MCYYCNNNCYNKNKAGVSAGTASKAAEVRKHSKYDAMCSELGWCCAPLAVGTYGAWGAEACSIFSFIAYRIAIMTSKPKSMILSSLYGKFGIILIHSYARAIMLRSLMPCSYWTSIPHLQVEQILRSVLVKYCHLAHVGCQVEMGSGCGS